MTIAIISLTLLAIGIAAVFLCRIWAPLLTIAGLSLLYFAGPESDFSQNQYWFWAIAALIAAGINFMLPPAIASQRAGVSYIAGGALVGAAVGVLISSASMIVGSVLGAFFGSWAYSRTPAGRILDFPSRRYVNYICAKGLPAIVVMCAFAEALVASFAL